VEGYAVAELVARADVVAPGLGGLVGELAALAAGLTGPGAGQMSLDEVERQVMVRGRELLRMTVQHVLDVRAAAEPRRAEVTGADGVRRRRAERGHGRTVLTWFGPVTVRRMAYRAPGAANLHPADAVLNLPVRRYSWQVQQAAVRYALAGSYEQARLWLADVTGVSIGKQQLEQILAEAARDAPGFYPSRPAAPCPAGLPLAISADGKGVAMRPGARRSEAARKARRRAPQAFGKRLGTGQKAGHKRIAETGAVFDVAPPDEPRTPEQILGRAPGQPAPHGPEAVNRWYTCEITASAAETIAAVFDQAERRDPGHARPWIALVDGDRHQIDVIRGQAAARGITVTILVDFIHVLEYLWKAAWCFCPPRDPAARGLGHRPGPGHPARPGRRGHQPGPGPGCRGSAQAGQRARQDHHPDPVLPDRQGPLPGLPPRPRRGLAHRHRRHRRRLPAPRRRPDGHHRRPLGPGRSPGHALAARHRRQRRPRHLLDLAHHPRTPAQPPQPLPRQPRPGRITVT
jgi:hypothetical protein